MRHLYQDSLKAIYYVVVIATLMSINAYSVIQLCRGY